jgi:hypothetical protein
MASVTSAATQPHRTNVTATAWTPSHWAQHRPPRRLGGISLDIDNSHIGSTASSPLLGGLCHCQVLPLQSFCRHIWRELGIFFQKVRESRD